MRYIYIDFFPTNAPNKHGADVDDNALAQSCVLFVVGHDHGQCAKHSNLLPKKA